MGHYDIDYEYEDDMNRLSSQAFKEKWHPLQFKPMEKKMGDNQSDNSSRWAPWEDHKVNGPRHPKVEDSYTVGDITEMRITVKRPGGSRIVLDVDGEPSYSFNLSTDETNALLIQLLNHRHE